jgi:hypothetical protein
MGHGASHASEVPILLFVRDGADRRAWRILDMQTRSTISGPEREVLADAPRVSSSDPDQSEPRAAWLDAVLLPILQRAHAEPDASGLELRVPANGQRFHVPLAT